MQKIPTLFVRDATRNGHPVIDEVKPECQWVLDGDGTATVKLDGTNVAVIGGVLQRRVKPLNIVYEEALYMLCKREDPADQWAWEAFDRQQPADGIYELLGPKIQGNKHDYPVHTLRRVSPFEPSLAIPVPDRSFAGLRQFLDETKHYEGLVFHHPDGRLAKIKRRDFGLKW